eukprot:Rmarinus@m.16319
MDADGRPRSLNRASVLPLSVEYSLSPGSPLLGFHRRSARPTTLVAFAAMTLVAAMFAALAFASCVVFVSSSNREHTGIFSAESSTASDASAVNRRLLDQTQKSPTHITPASSPCESRTDCQQCAGKTAGPGGDKCYWVDCLNQDPVCASEHDMLDGRAYAARTDCSWFASTDSCPAHIVDSPYAPSSVSPHFHDRPPQDSIRCRDRADCGTCSGASEVDPVSGRGQHCFWVDCGGSSFCDTEANLYGGDKWATRGCGFSMHCDTPSSQHKSPCQDIGSCGDCSGAVLRNEWTNTKHYCYWVECAAGPGGGFCEDERNLMEGGKDESCTWSFDNSTCRSSSVAARPARKKK